MNLLDIDKKGNTCPCFFFFFDEQERNFINKNQGNSHEKGESAADYIE